MACRIEGCERPVRNVSRQLCNRHHLRLLRHGDPEGGRPLRNEAPPERCTVDGCDQPHKGLGYCTTHYGRFKRNGDPETQTQFMGDPEASFEFRHEVAEDGCWIWTGARVGPGYGALRVGGATVYAHRYALEKHLGRPLSQDHHAHHRCGEPSCVNPEHLEEIHIADHARLHHELHRPGTAAAAGQTELGV